MISDYWRDQNRKLHESHAGFGIRGARHSHIVEQLCYRLGTLDVLDYGCGKAKLAASLPFQIQSYDPAIVEFSAQPSPAHIVVCTDVMEHVESGMVVRTLAEINRLSLVICYFAIATKPDWSKLMPDGSNPHRTVESGDYWRDSIAAIWGDANVMRINGKNESFFLCRKNPTIDLSATQWRIPS